ncbi:hypothetical protein [Burkholderia lata]|uniref:Uncharacterized protein n=1 Tax=Burkholderia lata (strain ATCC 17760 / DSM 23089 / LMG 22485 / NCIMB 9086 / R18194 / 383) TaxID=482957 RepID=A0A6P2LUW9_BURL3|nr:hypothetical protein [Burkholderia lata]VWB70967.1 hypothetical protein BLA6863_03332 [Burkholderia lata]
MARLNISDLARTAYQDEHQGWLIEVAVGYVVETDEWLAHAYVTAPGGSKEKVAIHEPTRPTSGDAVEYGFKTAIDYIDQMVDWRA